MPRRNGTGPVSGSTGPRNGRGGGRGGRRVIGIRSLIGRGTGRRTGGRRGSC